MGCSWSSESRNVSQLLEDAASDAPRYETRTGTILARVVDVYDGDTFTILLVSEGIVYRRRCRCLGYDAPEMRGVNAEKDRAIAARDHLAKVLPKGVFSLDFSGTDKYGRLLVTCRVGRDERLDEHMIRHGHGYAYHGGRKRTP